MDFPKRLKLLRTNKKMTQEELGKKINVTKVSVSGYESGNRKPDIETTQKIADFFEVSVDYLLGRTDNNRYNENKITSKATAADAKANMEMENKKLQTIADGIKKEIMQYVNATEDEKELDFTLEFLKKTLGK